MITHKEYMADSARLHQEYYLQFATEGTRQFVLNHIGLDKLLSSTDKYFNDIIKHYMGHWVWDESPCNLKLMKEAGAVSEGYFPSSSMCTCVGKAMARKIVCEHNTSEPEEQ